MYFIDLVNPEYQQILIYSGVADLSNSHKENKKVGIGIITRLAPSVVTGIGYPRG
jgi:hypothetical protein